MEDELAEGRPSERRPGKRSKWEVMGSEVWQWESEEKVQTWETLARRFGRHCWWFVFEVWGWRRNPEMPLHSQREWRERRVPLCGRGGGRRGVDLEGRWWDCFWKVGLKLNIEKTKIMASGPTTSWEIDGETVETVSDFNVGGFKITADGDCRHEIKKTLTPWKESYDQPR